jgi:hypothetical protein
VNGCTHQTPLFVWITIRWAGRTPSARPAIGATRSDPPTAGGGMFVNWIEVRWSLSHSDIL